MQSTPATRVEKTTAAAAGNRAGKYLVLQLGREEFAIRVLKVREIMGIQDVAALPQTPPYVKGVLNVFRLYPASGRPNFADPGFPGSTAGTVGMVPWPGANASARPSPFFGWPIRSSREE